MGGFAGVVRSARYRRAGMRDNIDFLRSSPHFRRFSVLFECGCTLENMYLWPSGPQRKKIYLVAQIVFEDYLVANNCVAETYQVNSDVLRLL
jgi:hypothetical protein